MPGSQMSTSAYQEQQATSTWITQSLNSPYEGDADWVDSNTKRLLMYFMFLKIKGQNKSFLNTLSTGMAKVYMRKTEWQGCMLKWLNGLQVVKQDILRNEWGLQWVPEENWRNGNNQEMYLFIWHSTTITAITENWI